MSPGITLSPGSSASCGFPESSGFTVVAGPARSGKTRRLRERYRRVLAEQAPGVALWLAPTQRAAVAVRQRILGTDLPGCLTPNCLTFGQFARRVLDASSLRIRPISLLVQRQILQGLVDEALAAGRLTHFAPIAGTPGFLDLLVGFVQELKRLEIWPQELRSATAAERHSQKDRELGHLYHEYQRLLNEHDLYDPQGRFWSARAQLREGQLRPFERVRHVFVDGFADFTRTEHEILDLLADRAESITISLPWEIDSPRAELFAKPQKTLEELQRRHAGLSIEDCSARPSAWPAMDHLERRLFTSPVRAATSPPATGIEIVAAGDATGEIESLARRIKTLLVEGDTGANGAPVAPGDVLVVFRSLTDAAEQVRETFAEFGIPAAIGSRPALASAPITSALTAWLRLDLDDWPFRRLLALVSHNFFRPPGPEWRQGQAARAADYVVRRLQVPSGRAALAREFERLAEDEDSSEAGASQAMLRRQAKLAWPRVRRMGELLDALPQRATLSDWARAVTRLAQASGMLQPLDASATPENTVLADITALADRRAWQQLIDALGESQRLNGWLGQQPTMLSRREFYEHLHEVLRVEVLAAGNDEAGRVRVLGAESARHLSAPYVFIAGLSERSFPPPDRDDCLYSAAETGQLVAAGLPLVSASDRRAHEMLLFYEVATRATRRLVLSYPALDAAAQPMSPSPYLAEVERAFSAGAIPRSGPPDLSPVPAPGAVYCPRDLRARSVANALEGDGALLARLAGQPATAPAAENLLAALAALSLRGGTTFGPWDGMLSSDAALAMLSDRFGPDHCWSPSQLEQYAYCPFQFFLARVLGIDAIEDPVLAVDYARRGQMLHWLLAMLHRGLNETAGKHISPGDLADRQLADKLSELAADLLVRGKSDRALSDGLLEVDVRRLLAWLDDYELQHEKYDKELHALDAPLRPAHFEVSFGPRRGAARENDELVDPLSTPEPFELECGGEQVRFAGRIDRIDLGRHDGQTVYGIIDYKSGRSDGAKISAIAEGLALQLPLYALAAEMMLGDRAIPLRVAYWHVAGPGCKESLDLHQIADGPLRPTAEWESLKRELPARIRSLLKGIRQGQFPMFSADDKCTTNCAYSTVCRVNQVRSLGKQWQPPREDKP